MNDDVDSVRGRPLGFWMCTALVIGNTMGMGIFLLPAALAPFGSNALVGWVVTVVGCLILAQAFVRLAREFPGAAGPFDYINSTFGAVPALLVVGSYWTSIWVTTAVISIGVVGYIAVLAPPVLTHTPTAVISLLLLWSFVAINCFGLRSGGVVQIVGVVLKLVPMVAVMLLGAWVFYSEPGLFQPDRSGTPVSASGVTGAATIALFAMLGFESASIPSDRVATPAITIPRATMIGTLLLGVIYVSVSAVIMLLVPRDALEISQAPFSDLFGRFDSGNSDRIVAVFIVASGLGALNGWVLVVGELTRSMATRGRLPAWLSRVNRHGAPGLALIATGLLSTGVVLLNVSDSLIEIFTVLSLLVTAASLPLYLFAALALVVLWHRKQPGAARGLIVFGVLGAIYSMYALIGVRAESALLAGVLVVIGVPLFLRARLRRRRASKTHS